MKNMALNIFAGALVVLSAFFFASVLCFAEGEDTDRYITHAVTISVVLGRVEVLPKGARNWQEGESGTELNEGDKVRTAEEAKAELVFKDGSFIRMKPDTMLEVRTARQEVSSETTQYNLELRVGEIMAEVQKLNKGSSFEVHTPTAVAAVRGTTFYMRRGSKVVDGVEKYFVEIYLDSDDTIRFTNTVSGDSSIVTQAQGATVYDDGTIEGPFDIPPAAQDAWKSGFDMVYDDSDASQGMRDVDTEGDDVSDDVDDVNEDQNDLQQGAAQDQSGEQDITGLARVDIITDSDGDGVLDSDDLYPADPNRASGNDADGDGIDDEFDPNDNDGPTGDLDGDGYSNTEDEFPRDFWEHVDTDNDSIGDFEDAFPEDDIIDGDIAFNDIYGNLVTVKGYGSRDVLRQATIDNLRAIEGLRDDIDDMINDIQARQFEALKEEIFDHQAGKVMQDRWGNRVRVEEYVSQPTSDQVQVLALTLRTAGPNAGISSLDFRVTFDDDINGVDLKTLPWDDYMNNPLVEDYKWHPHHGGPPGDDDNQLILYEQDNPGYYNPEDYDYPVPLEFSLEAKNPYAESVKATETYSGLNLGIIKQTGKWSKAWYQVQEGTSIEINGQAKEYADKSWYNEWGQGWNQENRFTFLDRFSDGSWLMGAFYLIDDNGNLVDVEEDEDGLLDIRGIRDCINPDHNLEMVFLSSEFTATTEDLPDIIAAQEEVTDAYERYLYQTYRTIDVITIPEITEPYEEWQD